MKSRLPIDGPISNLDNWGTKFPRHFDGSPLQSWRQRGSGIRNKFRQRDGILFIGGQNLIDARGAIVLAMPLPAPEQATGHHHDYRNNCPDNASLNSGGHESPPANSVTGMVSFRKSRAPRKSPKYSRWSSHASHTLRRSGVCSFGLFQRRAQTASERQPRAEHLNG